MNRVVIEETRTPDGAPLVLAREGAHYVISVAKERLMSSEMYGSEQAMAFFAREEFGSRKGPRILVGGLGMGFTLRAALDHFDKTAKITVAELLPDLVRFNRGVLADLAGRPLDDPRVELYEGDVRHLLRKRRWDVVLMDVDNGPDALTASSNQALYNRRGVADLAHCLEPGGVLVVWSAYPSPNFEERVAETGLSCRTKYVRGRWPMRKGPRHVLTIASRPTPHAPVRTPAGLSAFPGGATGAGPHRARRPSSSRG